MDLRFVFRSRTRVPLHGFALQCRVTTEDPSNRLRAGLRTDPDLSLARGLRHPARWRIGLWRSGHHAVLRFAAGESHGVGPRLSTQACQRMDRALREFRIRGVKTNIPFLENVVITTTFQPGEATTRFLDDTPELFQFTQRQDRATKLLTYLGEIDRQWQ